MKMVMKGNKQLRVADEPSVEDTPLNRAAFMDL